MHCHMKRMLRLGPCAPARRRTPPGGNPRSASAAQPRVLGAAGWSAPRCRRSYASDAAYGRAFASARDDPEGYWAESARDIDWFEPWSKTLHVGDPVFPDW